MEEKDKIINEPNENTTNSSENNTENNENDSQIDESNNKKIEVVTGNGNLNISPVYEHLEVEKPKPKENRTILIPEVKKDLIQPKEEVFDNKVTLIDVSNQASDTDSDEESQN